MRIKSVPRVTFLVKDIERATRFYEALGFQFKKMYRRYLQIRRLMNKQKPVTLTKYKKFLSVVIKKIQADDSFHPDTIVALSTGGFPVAAATAKRLGIKSRNVVGIPVYKDETGDYHLDEQLVSLGDYSNRQVLVIDEASKRGFLTRKAVTAIEDRGGKAKSCVLIAWKKGLQPDFVAETCTGEPPDFYWEV